MRNFSNLFKWWYCILKYEMLIFYNVGSIDQWFNYIKIDFMSLNRKTSNYRMLWNCLWIRKKVVMKHPNLLEWNARSGGTKDFSSLK